MNWKALAASLVLAASPAYAQPAATLHDEQPTVATVIDADTLQDLPTSNDLFSILETTQPSIVSDRFSEGGLNVGRAARIGSFFSSWTATRFRIGDVDISDPTGSGAPLLLPDLALWQRMTVSTGMMPVDLNAPGLEISLEPKTPGTTWVRSIAAAGSLSNAVALPSGPPPIARLDAWSRASASAGGPLLADGHGASRLRGFFAASWTRGLQFDRAQPAAASATMGSGFAQLLFTPNERDEIKTIAWLQQSTYPLDERAPLGQPSASAEDKSAHLQASWERHSSETRAFHVYAGYTQRQRTPDYSQPQGAASAVVPAFDEAADDPVATLGTLSSNVVRQWSAGVRVLPADSSVSPGGIHAGAHTLQGGVEIGGAQQRASSFFSGTASESINGAAARLWTFMSPGIDSVRRATTLTAYLDDHVTLAPRLALDAGVRFDSTAGSAQGAARGVNWRSWLPRASLQWTLAETWETKAFVGVGRSADRLTLDVLAVGDPAAPTADIFTPTGTLIAHAGPGTGGNPAFSGIDANLKRPYTDEFVIGLASHLGHALSVRVAGFARREGDLLGVVNTGAPAATAYSTVSVAAPGVDLTNAGSDEILTVYNRLAASFGKDQYLLTNPQEEAATSESFEISAELKMKRLTLFGGGTASVNGPAANIGYGPLDNDQAVLGALFIDPNAATFARGRLFTDRAYTVKVSGVYRLPGDIRLGVIARYQDGQPFAQLVAVPGLNQGTELVRAIPNGLSRFSFTETVDARLQKGFGVGGVRVEGMIDVFNLLGASNEVDEQTISGPQFRAVTAVQPPRAVDAGLRVTF